MLNSGVKCISEAGEQNLLDLIEDQNEVTIILMTVFSIIVKKFFKMQ